MSVAIRALAVSFALVLAAGSAAAGQQGYMAPLAAPVTAPPGWSVTPSLGAIVSRTLALTAAGLLAGVAISSGLARAVRSLLFGVSAGDPLTFDGHAGTLSGRQP